MLRKGKTLVRESKKTTKSADINAIKEKIAKRKKLVEESKEGSMKSKVKAKMKAKSTRSKTKTKKVISESKKKEIDEIKAKKKLAKKSKPVKDLLASDSVKDFVTESIKKKISALGKKRSLKKDVIKEADGEDDTFDDLLEIEDEVEVGDGNGIGAEVELDINTDEPLEIVIAQDDLEEIVMGIKDELVLDEEFINTVVNRIAGQDEPVDDINDDLNTEVDADMIDELDFENEGDILNDMLEEEGLAGKRKKSKTLATESFNLKLDGDLVLEGFEVDEKRAEKMMVNIFKYKASMLDKVTEHESTIGKLSLVVESLMADDDEINKFEVEVDEEGDTITINSSSKIADVSGTISKHTGLSVGKVKMDTCQEEIEIEDDEIDEYEMDVNGINKW